MRALARWGVTPLLASPLAASALGLGDIELKSALNQPLQAEITLVSATPEELEGLRIALATRETFARYGLDRPEYLSALQFSLDRDAAGRAIIRVTSRESMAEPFVTMLIEATWPRGRLLREYTVLLDPPVLLPQPAVATAVNTPSTRAADGAAGGSIARTPAPAPTPSAQTPRPAASAPAPRPSAELGGSYGPVQRAETLWNIADNLRPAGVSVNQMMVALYEANAEAFGGNMNRLLQGAVLRVPDAAALRGVTETVANAEVRRQNEEWQGGAVAAETARLRLLPAEDVGAGASAAPAAAGSAPAPASAANAAEVTSLRSEVNTLRSELEESRRLLELRNEELRQLQERLAAAENSPAPAAPVDQPLPAEPVTAPGVDLEEQLFADEEPAAAEPEPEAAVAETPAPAAAPPPAATRVAATQPEPSLLSRVLGWVTNPMVLIGVGIAALLLAVVGFMRRRREEEPEDVTGRWDALEEEIERDEHESTARMRRQVPDDGFVVEEQTTRRPRAESVRPEPEAGAAAALGAAALASDETLSAQTVIDLDQADPVAEADFHMAYGLYDQAAELITKALEQNPGRRDLQLKLLDVFFVWGNKEGFLSAAQDLREQMGDRPDADWDKVVIMGKQICPDASLFAAATTGAPEIDLEFDAGTSSAALDLAFEDESADGQSLDFDPSADDTAEDLAFSPTARRAQLKSAELDDSLDIGERTAAGLEAALFEGDDEGAGAAHSAFDADADADADSLAVTQESPTVERPSSGLDWDALSIDSPTGEAAVVEAPTVETPTIESPAADAPTMETPTIETAASLAPTMETPTVETAFWQDEPATVESPAYAADDVTDGTAEIDLDDLGLDVADLEALPADLGELSAAADRETDTREQPQIGVESDLLSATGVTQVLSADIEDLEQRETAVLADDDATMLASLDEDTLGGGTEVLDSRYKVESTGETSLVESLKDEGGLDLNLDDFSAALSSGGDTVEQPRMFGGDVFDGGNGGTPLDLDVGIDVLGADDPTGTEEVSPLDPQTMTEVGTKLDLARAYIDMGDPEGARSILEEVLDEGDAGQRREAQSLIEGLAV